MHHWSDVLAGSILGITDAFIVVSFTNTWIDNLYICGIAHRFELCSIERGLNAFAKSSCAQRLKVFAISELSAYRSTILPQKLQNF